MKFITRSHREYSSWYICEIKYSVYTFWLTNVKCKQQCARTRYSLNLKILAFFLFALCQTFVLRYTQFFSGIFLQQHFSNFFLLILSIFFSLIFLFQPCHAITATINVSILSLALDKMPQISVNWAVGWTKIVSLWHACDTPALKGDSIFIQKCWKAK